MREPLQPGRLVSFTLRDVPTEIRRRAGRRLVDLAADELNVLAAVELTRAIEEPSDTRYRIPEDAFRRVVG